MSLKITKYSAAYWRATIDNPPLNLFDQEMSDALVALMDELEKDKEIKVIVFDSADPDYFISHLDVLRAATMSLDPGPTGLSPWPDFALRLGRAPFISIGLLRGRARGVGSEFLQALDMRFASLEKAKLCQLEMGCGLIPGGGGMERLPLLIGRARALEVISSADDYDAATAEKYGWINRAIPDAELDEFVDRLAKRISGFSKKAITAAKELIDKRTSIARVEDLAATQKIFFDLLSSTETQARIAVLFEKGLQQRGDFEYNLGEQIAFDN